MPEEIENETHISFTHLVSGAIKQGGVSDPSDILIATVMMVEQLEQFTGEDDIDKATLYILNAINSSRTLSKYLISDDIKASLDKMYNGNASYSPLMNVIVIEKETSMLALQMLNNSLMEYDSVTGEPIEPSEETKKVFDSEEFVEIIDSIELELKELTKNSKKYELQLVEV